MNEVNGCGVVLLELLKLGFGLLVIDHTGSNRSGVLIIDSVSRAHWHGVDRPD